MYDIYRLFFILICVLLIVILLMKRIKIDNNIFQNKQEWSFAKKIAPKFDAHIKKSIPFYEEYQWLCSEISDYFVSALFEI